MRLTARPAGTRRAVRDNIRAVVLVAALLLTGYAVSIAPPAAQAASVRDCPGIGLPPNGPRMMQDEHGGAGSQLALGINALICSADDGATIDIKSWFVTVRGTAMTRMISVLRLMHAYHHVHVNVFIAKSWYTPQQWSEFRQAFSFATVWSCARACMSGIPGSIDHSKWMTVSRLRARNGGGTVVLSTSLNPSGEQFDSGQSGIAVFRDPTVYAPFQREWNAYVSCASGHGCNHVIPTGQWQGLYRTKVWFEPSKLDPTHEALKTLNCSHGGLIDVMSLYLYRTTILSDLLRLRAQGCRVNVILEHWDPSKPAPWTQLHPKCAFNHDKMVLIGVGSLHEVIAGSQDQTPSEVLDDDNQMVMTTNPYTVAHYWRYFNDGWATSSAQHCSTGGYFG